MCVLILKKEEIKYYIKKEIKSSYNKMVIFYEFALSLFLCTYEANMLLLEKLVQVHTVNDE